METMEWQWFKAHVGALGQNGVWDTTTITATKLKRILDDTLEKCNG